MERQRTNIGNPRRSRSNRGTLALLGAALVVLAAGAWLLLDDRDEPVAEVVGVDLGDILGAPDSYMGRTVTVSAEVIEDDLLEEDAAGATIIGTREQPLLVIAAQADELPPTLEDGETLLVTGEVGVLRPDAGGDTDPVLEEGPLLERFRGRPFLRATDVQPGHADS